MFSAVLFASEENDAAAMERLAMESNQVSIQKTLYHLPQVFEVSQILNTHAPDLVFLDMSKGSSALATANSIRNHTHRPAIIGFGGGWQRGREAECKEAGITDLLVSPVTLKEFEAAVDRAIHKMHAAVQQNLIAFLPAKAGGGCTTIALNTAGHLAGAWRKDAPLKKVLLIEADLHSGVISVLLDVKPQRSIVDALEHSGELDYSLWTQYVMKIHDVDFLLADPRKKVFSSWTNYHHLLDFAASRYDYILVDLPEVVNDATVETVRRAKSVFVVCTPELPSLALAQQRCEELQNRGIPAEKTTILLNRWHKGEIAASEFEEIIKHRVSAVFMNDYPTVSKAARAHDFVKPGAKLGQSFAEFAGMLAGEPPVVQSPSRSFLRFG